MHIFIEKAICIPNLAFLKLLVFSFFSSPFSVTAAEAAAAVTFFRIERKTKFRVSVCVLDHAQTKRPTPSKFGIEML